MWADGASAEVVLHTNSPGLSSQNGQIEGTISEVMSLTSVQLQCSYLAIVVWDRSFMHAIFIIARRPKLRSRRPYLKDTWHKIPWTALTGRLFDFTVLICG